MATKKAAKRSKPVKLTDQYLRTIAVPLDAPDARITIRDMIVPRFEVRVARGGAKTFVIRYRHRGRQVRLTLGHYPALTLADARDLAKKKLALVEQGHDPAAERRADREAPTFATLATEYIERHAKVRKRSWKADERHLRVDVLPVLGDRVAKDITRRDVRALVEDIAQRAPVHANRILALVKGVLAVA